MLHQILTARHLRFQAGIQKIYHHGCVSCSVHVELLSCWVSTRFSITVAPEKNHPDSSFFSFGRPTVSIVAIAFDFTKPFGGLPFNIPKTAYLFSGSSLMQGACMLFWMPVVSKWGRRPVYVGCSIFFLLCVVWAGLAKTYAQGELFDSYLSQQELFSHTLQNLSLVLESDFSVVEPNASHL